MLAFVFSAVCVILFWVTLKKKDGLLGKAACFLFPICAQLACNFIFTEVLRIKKFGLGAIGAAIVLYVFGAVPLLSAVMGLIGRMGKKFDFMTAAANACGIVFVLLSGPIRAKNLLTFLLVFGYVALMFFITLLCSGIKIRGKRLREI